MEWVFIINPCLILISVSILHLTTFLNGIATEYSILTGSFHSLQTGHALSAANALLQAVEVALPKQKKTQAVSEFKHSVIAHKRRVRVQQNSGMW
jgi:hypothetical protein